MKNDGAARRLRRTTMVSITARIGDTMWHLVASQRRREFCWVV